MSDTITITRALSKIKTLTKELNKGTSDKDFFGIARNAIKGTPSYIKSKSDLKANYESILDKIDLIVELKTAISKSNLESTITINKEEITVTEALAKKECMSLYTQLLTTLRRQAREANYELDNNQRQIERAITEASGQASSTSLETDKNLFTERLNIIQEQLVNTMGIHTLSGTNKTPEEIVEELDQYINSFTSEIDYILSEHNALTTIEVN